MILVSGATGLIGSHLLLELSRSGVPFKAMKRQKSSLQAVRKLFRYYHSEALFSGIHWVEADILEPDQLYDAMQHVKHIYHCAGLVSFDDRKANHLMRVNVEGTANIVNVALEMKIEKICHVSSTSALGSMPENAVVDEHAVWSRSAANSDYASSKHLAEMEIWRGIEEGLNAVIVNPAIVIGPGAWGRSSTGIFQRIYRGMKMYPKGGNAYVDVRDVVNIMLKLMNGMFQSERYILVAGNLAFKDFFTLVARHLHKPAPFIRATPLMGEIAWRLDKFIGLITGTTTISKDIVRAGNKTVQFSNSKIVQALNYRFIPVEESISQTCEIFLHELNGDRV